MTISVNYTTEQTDDAAQDQPQQPGRGRNMPRKGTASVRYSEYKVNTGLSDEIFEKKKEDKK